MKNIIKAIGLATLVALFSGCNRNEETRILRNPAIENIFNDGTLAVYGDYKNGISRPEAFIYAKDLKFCMHLGKPIPYPTAGRASLPYIELEGNGKATLHLKYNQALVVSDVFPNEFERH